MINTAKSLRALAISAFACLSTTAGAQQPLPSEPTQAEMPLLPPYCGARFAGSGSPVYHAWEAKLGPGFLHLHHYCSGLNYMNRYRMSFRDPQRAYYLSRVVPEMDYSLQKVGNTFPLLGQMYVNRGRANVLLKQNVAAIEDFIRATKADPKNVDAYIEQSKLLEANNKRKEALVTIERGLQHAPGSAPLRKRHQELGGTP